MESGSGTLLYILFVELVKFVCLLSRRPVSDPPSSLAIQALQGSVSAAVRLVQTKETQLHSVSKHVMKSMCERCRGLKSKWGMQKYIALTADNALRLM